MARHRPIFNRWRSLTDRDEILDLSPSIASKTRLFRSTDRALRSKMAKQLFLSPLIADIPHPKPSYKNPIDIHGTAATMRVPIKSAIM